MVVKVQRSLATNEGAGQMLVYNEDRSLLVQTALPDEMRSYMGERPKVYLEAELDGTELVFTGPAEDQPW